MLHLSWTPSHEAVSEIQRNATISGEVQSDETRAECKADENRIEPAPVPHAISSAEPAEQFVFFRLRYVDNDL